jgi:hypothetical protein
MINKEKELLRSTYKTSAFSESKPLVLTTKRLIIGDRKIPLTDILEAYTETKGILTAMSRLAIRLKDGEVIVCTPKAESGVNFFNPEMSFKANVDRWVTLINRVLSSTPIS